MLESLSQGNDPTPKLAVATLASLIVLMPVYAIAAIGPMLTESGSPVVIGWSISGYFVISATLSTRSLRWYTQRTRHRMVAATITLAVVSLCVVASEPTPAVIVVAVAFAGIGHAVVQPIANDLIVASTPPQRRAWALTVKQASAPAAGAIVGVVLPLASGMLSWRAALVLPALVCGALFALLPSVRGPWPSSASQLRTYRPARPRTTGLLLRLTIAGGLCTAAANGLTACLVNYGNRLGCSPDYVGVVFSVASVSSLLLRLVLARLPFGEMRIICPAVTVAAAGYILLSLQRADLLVPGAIMGLGGGWSWTGLLVHSVTRRVSSEQVAGATAVLQIGLSLGAAVGPIGVALIAASAGYPTAWLLSAATSALAAAIFATARSRPTLAE